jgi:hypothetical protein
MVVVHCGGMECLVDKERDQDLRSDQGIDWMIALYQGYVMCLCDQ